MPPADRSPHDADSSGCLPQGRCTPSSPHSHSSSALYSDDAIFPLPWRVPQPGSKRGQAEKQYGRVKQEHPSCIPLPHSDALNLRPADRKAERMGECRSSAFLPRKSFGDALAVDSSSAFQGESKGVQSDSDHADENFTTWEALSSEQDGSGDSGVKSSYRGITFDRKKRQWRVQVKAPRSGKSGVSFGYFDTEEAATRAFDRAKHGSQRRDAGQSPVKFPRNPFQEDQERHRLSRKKPAGRQRTSRFTGVGSSNRKNQWQARILVHGKVTHLGYYETEEEAARVYDRVAISLNPRAQTNFPVSQYSCSGLEEFKGLGREELQRALGVKPMDKSSQFRGVSRKKGKWEAKVMVNRKWAYRALFDSEAEAAKAYDAALWRLKPKEAVSFVNFKDGMSVRTGKRPPRLTSTLQRSKSQKLDRASSAGSGSLLQNAEGILMLMPEDLDESEGPSTPTRRHSVQLPLSQPLECRPITRQCSAVADGLERVASLPEELPVLNAPPQVTPAPDLSPQQSTFSRRPSYGQLQPALSGVPLMSLPDPNSIGVPPPSEKLPFPELVGLAGGTSQPELELSSTPRHMPVRVPSQGPNLSVGPAQPVMQSSSCLPAIPPPLLPAEASRLSMGTYYSGTPLSRSLSQALSASTHLQEYGGEQSCPNPFQDAASSLPPITAGPDMLVRVGSEAHVIQDQQPSMQKLNSMTPSLDMFPQRQASMALQRMSSMHCGTIQRAASESLLRNPAGSSSPPDMHLSSTQSHATNIQEDGYQTHSFGELQQFDGEMTQQSHLLDVNSLANGMLQTTHVPMQSAQSVAMHGTDPSSHLPRSFFEDYRLQATPFEPKPERSLSHMDSSATYGGGGALRSCRTATTELLSGLLSGEDASLHRSMSTSNLAQGRLPTYGYCDGSSLPHRTASAQIYPGLQNRASVESNGNAMALPSGLPPLPMKGSRESSHMDQIAMPPSDAAALMAELGVELCAADCHLPLRDVQIGGEDLFAPKSGATVRF